MALAVVNGAIGVVRITGKTAIGTLQALVRVAPMVQFTMGKNREERLQ